MDSYNSKYPLEYYEVGTPYMFYLGTGKKNGKAATMEQIEKYGPALKKTNSQKGEGFYFADRVIGVVVEKEGVSPRTGEGAIVVLFQGISDGTTIYLTKKYVTNSAGVFCDDKEQFNAAGLVDLTGEINVTVVDKNGGIDLDTGRSGGIDLDIDPQNGGIDLD